MRVTLRDIAEHINVSVSTVSRALNGHHYVDETTRKMVREAAEILGYPLGNLRSPPKGQRAVVLLTYRAKLKKGQIRGLPDVEEALALGIQSTFEQYGITTRIQRTQMRQEEVQLYADDPGVGGLILLGGLLDRDFVQQLQEAGIPFVVAGAGVRSLLVNCVTADYMRGTEQAVTHLLARGRQHIGLVNGPLATQSSEEKYRGFRLALSLHALSFRPDQMVVSDFDPESGYTQTLQLLAQRPDLDAIVYAGDDIAVGGLHALKERGRQVPDDVAVVGFYDNGLARFTDPPLTSVHVDLPMMGVIAAKRSYMLLVQPDDQAWSAVVPTLLIVREST